MTLTLGRRLACMLHLAWVYARSWLRTLCRLTPWWCRDTTNHGPTVYRVYVFNEGENAQDGPEEFYRELSPRYLNPSTWEDDVREMTGWTTFRVEVRYTLRHKKYRMILRPGDSYTCHPYQEPSAPACRLPKGVLSARLQGPLGSDIDCDVTQRVMKYQGPRGDFHAGLGLAVKLQDMFPFDDHVDNTIRFTHLRIMDTMARLHDFAYATNPALKLGRHTD